MPLMPIEVDGINAEGMVTCVTGMKGCGSKNLEDVAPALDTAAMMVSGALAVVSGVAPEALHLP